MTPAPPNAITSATQPAPMAMPKKTKAGTVISRQAKARAKIAQAHQVAWSV
jgi:hypothetical protein